MYFISILIVVAILRYQRQWLQRIQNDAWFFYLQTKSQAHPVVELIVSIALPTFVVYSLFSYFHQSSLGIFSLVVAVIVLMYSLGRGEFVCLFEDYKTIWQDPSQEKLSQLLQKLEPELTINDSDRPCDLHVKARELFIYHAFTRLFVVLFWFSLLGPAAAVCYRLSKLALSRHENSYIRLLESLFEWPVARLFALSVALLGNFNASINFIKNTLTDRYIASKALIHQVTLLSLNLDTQWQTSRFVVEHSQQEIAQKAISETQAIQELLHRTLLFTVVFIAIVHVII